ncbi:hypothetical protein IWQ61_005988 [Dispira simplex]|nr:hypothetical protein IWQ61_005988 [Dispira simplex]
MPRNNKSKKIGDGIPSKQEQPRQYGLDNPRLARRGRGRSHNHSRRRSPSPGPSHRHGHPTTNLKQYELDNPRLARRGRGRSHNHSCRRSSSPNPSRIRDTPITSATEFSREHRDAHHVVSVLNCPMEEVVPLNHCSEDLLHRIRAFWALDREDQYNRNHCLLTAAIAEAADVHNGSLTVRIASGMYACMNAIMDLVEHNTREDLLEWDPNNAEILSKFVTADCVDILCHKFLFSFTQLNSRKYPTRDYCPMSWDAQVLPERYNFTVRPDRVIFHAQSKQQRTPFAWVTINPDYLAPTSEEYESIFPQIAAQTIAMARYQPHEVFGLEFSHHYVTFWRTLIPKNYMELVKDSGDLSPDMVLKMKRSTMLDLELQDGHHGFTPAFLALLMYWNKQVEPSE